jgi:hypothetical protein
MEVDSGYRVGVMHGFKKPGVILMKSIEVSCAYFWLRTISCALKADAGGRKPS